MQIRCWGSRGGIPVSGPTFNKYGGDTTCMEVRSSSGELIIIDAGSGIRGLGYSLINDSPSRSAHFLFTHVHLDHLMGFPFFSPAYKKDFSITVRGCPFELPSFKDALSGIMRAPYFPVDLASIAANIEFMDISPQIPFTIGSLTITPILLNHPNGCLGYKIQENNRTFIFLTDNELGNCSQAMFDSLCGFCENADLLIHDAEFTQEEYFHFRNWGHSTIDQVAKLALQSRVKHLGLFHINNSRTDEQVDGMVSETLQIFKKNHYPITCCAVGNQFSVTLL